MAKKVWTAKARVEFAARMKAARAKKNPAKFDRCVRKVKKSLKKYRRKGSAYAICAKVRTRRKNPKLLLEKGYIVWNYWDNKILARTPSWKEADAALKKAVAARGEIPADWFGIEAVENIHSGPLNNPVRVRDPQHKALVGKLRRHFSHDEALLKRAEKVGSGMLFTHRGEVYRSSDILKRPRYKNPPDRFILKLERGAKKVTLYYDGANFTAMRSRAHRFSSKEMAVLMGKHMLKKYPVLRGTAAHPFRLYVTRP